MPEIYHFMDPDFQKLMKILAHTENFSFFGIRAIQSIIEFNYSLVKKCIILFMAIPFVIYHVFYVTYTNAIYDKRYEPGYETINWAFIIIILFFSLYFLVNEFRKFAWHRSYYFTNVWNQIDLIAPSSVICVMILTLLEKYGYEIKVDASRSMLAISTLAMWFKLLYFLRIFKTTGYLMRALVETIFDMWVFLLVYVIAVFGFGDALLKISDGNPPD